MQKRCLYLFLTVLSSLFVFSCPIPRSSLHIPLHWCVGLLPSFTSSSKFNEATSQKSSPSSSKILSNHLKFGKLDQNGDILVKKLILQSSAKLVIEQRPHLNTVPQPILRRRGAPPNSTDQLGVGRSRDKSRKGKAQDELASTTRGEGVAGLDEKKEGFRKRSKLMTVSLEVFCNSNFT